jgi:pyruvate dehydrogenase E2 component (dihydrolipoamide acetyltransferase)
MSAIEVKVPDIGDFKDVEVIEVLVKPGDTIKAEQSLITVESDKASMEIPSSAAGVLKELRVKLGDKINQGDLLAIIQPQAAAPAPAAGARRTAASGPAPATIPPSIARQSSAPAAKSPAPAASPAASTAPTPDRDAPVLELTVPDIGDFKDVEVIELLVKAGDSVAVEQSLMTVESDKASMEIPAASAGVIRELRVKVGDKVNQGSVIATLTASAAPSASAPDKPAAGEAAAPAPAAPAGEAPDAPPVAALEPDRPAAELPHASPSVRKFARELGVDLRRVASTGPKGRIVADDVRNYVKGALASPAPAASAAGKGEARALVLLPWPALDFSKFGATEIVPLSRIKKISGLNLARNWAMIPHVTQFDEVDITELEAFRRDINEAHAKEGVKITMLAFVIKACVSALRRFPNFNSSLDERGENLILKSYYHIGFAADTPQGLVVPVVRDCDRKGVIEIASETSQLAGKARDGKLSPGEMQGASFTISSLGGIGGTAFTPIINAPEVAILGLSKSDMKPRWDGKQFAPRLMLPTSLSYDHRVIDGAQAARFTVYLGELLADMRRVLL